ncbi:MAG: hypothetical protein ACQESK_00315 [Bacteroidota bacterium]
MKRNNLFLRQFPKQIKMLIGLFVVILSIGFFTGIRFVDYTTDSQPKGIEENYLGNEENDSAKVMKFKKSEQEILNLTHTHILSMSTIFFLLSGLAYFTKMNSLLKQIIMTEPLLAVLTTFGGIYLLWKGIMWMKYVIMISGLLMTISFLALVILILIEICAKNKS